MLRALKPILVPIKYSLDGFIPILYDEMRMRDFLLSRGWLSEIGSIDTFRNSLDIESAMEDTINLINNLQAVNDKTDILVEELIPSLKYLFTLTANLSSKNPSLFTDFPLNQSTFWIELGNDLIDFILISYLEKKQISVYTTLLLFGIIKYEEIIPSEPKRVPYLRKTFAWEKLGSLLFNPFSLIKEEYNWQSGNIDYQYLFEVLTRVANKFNIKPVKRLLSKEVYEQFYENYDLPVNHSIKEIEFPFLCRTSTESNDFQKLSIIVVPSIHNETIDGLLIIPNFVGYSEFSVGLAPNLGLLWQGYFTFNNNIALQVIPGSLSKILYQDIGETPLNSKLTFVYAPSYPQRLIGDNSGIRLYNNGAEFSLQVAGSINDPEFILRIGMGDYINKPNFIFVYDPSENDNFIKKVLGSNPFQLDFGVALRWSSKTGIGVEGMVGLSIEIPLHKDKKSNDSSFPIKLSTIRINALGSNDGGSLTVGMDFNLNLSAVKASVRDIGLKLTFNKVEGGSSKGLLNNLDTDISFKFPSGVALEINAPPVKGGGFLNYDQATSTYTGGLELQFSKISFTAIGIISTKLPGGESGYSLLVIVSVEFTPLQIGMGFTINGIGGLLGLHRTSNPDALRSGIRYNTLDHILFPQNIVENANTIISNLGQVFPARKDQFMLGPMAKIGWGTPTLLTIDVGIVIEMPDPVRLLILGILRAQLPSAENAILRLQVNFLGIIDFKENYLSFDASLYDSKILTFGLYGDMALRLNWGNRPNFLLSVGGFHPSYTPPPLNLPSMKRLTIVLADQSNLKIAVESYFAVTSNSAQFGAHVYAMARAGKFRAEGELWFNVLFQFSPFYFAADMGVKFAIKVGSKTLLGVYVALMLEGPDPWRAQGQATFKILFVKVKIRFNATFGSQRVEAIEAVQIDDKIKEALMLPDNWETLLPDQNNQMVAWRKEQEDENQSVDPSGTIKINQRILPLNTVMEKFGSAAISDFNSYRIRNSRINSMTVASRDVQDYFARNEFTYMSDEEKLSRDGYELFDSGVVIGSTDNHSAQYAVHKACDFEEITIDSGYRRKAFEKFRLTAQRMEIEGILDYTSRTRLSRSRRFTTNRGPIKTELTLKGGEFVFANRNNLRQVGSLAFSNSLEAEAYLNEQRLTNPTSVEDWIITNRYELVE